MQLLIVRAPVPLDREWQMAAIAGIAPLKESLRIFIIATHALFLQQVIRQILLRFPAWRGPGTLCPLLATHRPLAEVGCVWGGGGESGGRVEVEPRVPALARELAWPGARNSLGAEPRAVVIP